MPKQDRGAPARPPWLPEEEERRGVLSLFRRGRKGNDDAEDESSPADTEKSAPSKSKKAADEQPVDTKSVAPEPSNDTKAEPEASRYYIPPRPDVSAQPVEPPVAESKDVAPEVIPEDPKIFSRPDQLPEMKPAPRSISSFAPPSASEFAAPVEPEAAAPELVTPAELPASFTPSPAAPVAEQETPEPPVAATTGPASAPLVADWSRPEPVEDRALQEPPVSEDVAPEAAPSDPFSRFSELEAKLRQTSLDESILGENAERRRHRMPEPELEPAPTATVTATPAPTLRFTPPEAVEKASEAAEKVDEVEGVAEVDAAESLLSAPESETPDVVTSEPAPQPQDDVVEQPAVVEQPVVVEAEPIAEPVENVDDVDARAAALLQRIEAKREQLNQERAAFEASEPAVAQPDPEPTLACESVTESPAAATEEVTPEQVVPEPEAEPAVAAADPELVAAEPEEPLAAPAPAQSVQQPVEPPFAEVSSEAPEEPVQVVPEPEPQEERGEAAAVPEESAASAEAAEAPAELEQGVVQPDPHPSGSEATSDESQDADTATGQPGRGLATPSWEIPNAVQPAPAAEPLAAPVYPVPQQQPPVQQPAAQAPPGWNPRQPYPGQWPQGAPAAPQPYGGQQFQQQPPPQPTSVPGQWQWVPQQHAPQPPQQQGPPPGQQEPPAGYVPPPQATAPPANYRAPQAYRMPPSLDEAEIINRGRYAPKAGWRKAVHAATGGHVNPGDSRKDREHDQLLASIRQPILGDYRIAVLSIKGGVGKTTTTLGLGSAFATIRTDRIIAVDANPDRGTLAERVRDNSTQSTVRDLLHDQNIRSYADVRNHTRMATSRLEVLASEQDPAVSEAFGAVDYRNTIDILQRYYNIILTDCGTGIMHSAMAGVLELAHTIVLVSSPAMDSARSASATLDWLMQHGYSALVREAHVVLSASRPGSAGIKLDKVYEHFAARCRSIHMIPFDPHLAEGADVDFNLLNTDTNEAYLKLAGAISESFPRLHGPR
ncbi:AAA family ATPase [Mycobacterium sp. CBMA271]|uniref:AAA family ATPase n=1 Tax=unclassified Mycobacteroides TaxID=2618759 RepID=UPI0012DD4F93|nr:MULTISPECIES: AAA family ATPase [unclassified Mycobacteroides]MUM16978.1 hypothetical protein [Mycobacteroides sp. CBMA 326]MUM24034.1 AAA family ATPase [Mycobacteroides sp. CBMA 271]